jgi:site-specific DNA recombinase
VSPSTMAQAAILREIATRHLAGESFYRIANDLDMRDIPTPAGGPRWWPTNLSRLMKNPAYAGLRVHRGEVIGDAQWPAIFDDSTWRQLQSVLLDPARNTTDIRTAAHLLTGIALCGVCDAAVRIVKNRGYPAYVCSAAFHVARRETVLDTYVTEVLIEWLERARQAGTDPVHGDTDDTPLALTQARTELETVKARLDDHYAEARTGAISARALAAIEPPLLADLDRLNSLIRRLTTPRPVLTIMDNDDMRAAWQSLDMDHKRAMVRAVVTPAILPTGKGKRTFRPDHVELRWKLTPHLNRR